jgi:ABC-2 type transport system ATP-binding protein
MIKLIGLSKVYKGFHAVNDINIDVKAGVIFGFLGPNGAGKTTTLKMMAGIIKPTSGQVIINGINLAENPSAVKQCVGFIPDRPFLYEKLSGLEFLLLIAGLYRLDHTPLFDSRISELLELFDLDAWKDELIESYSHGMKQRLVMCASLLHKPKVLIVDEPMVGLDPKAARLVKAIFKEQASNGTTIFMSTHSLGVAQEICNEIAILQTGQIVAKGTSETLSRTVGLEDNLEHTFLKLTEDKRFVHEKSLPAH